VVVNRKLFIFEMANNHMGDVEHGKQIIEEFAAVKEKYPCFDFGFKFQFRDIKTFIHPDYQDRIDIKYVKRFQDTNLSDDQFMELKTLAEARGFIPICTGFDEASVDRIERMKFPVIKVASCSFTDWPLLNRIADTDVPLIASTAGATSEDIDNVVSFFLNRKKDLTIMHCVGEYPTKESNLQLNQLKNLKDKYPDIRIGYSTHEDPGTLDVIPIAIGMGAEVFEKHVDIQTGSINAYSSTPDQVNQWLKTAEKALNICGVSIGRHVASGKELSDLRTFKRGVFVNRDIKSGESIRKQDVFYAFPCGEGQILANDMSKYVEHVASVDINKNDPVQFDNVDIKNLRESVLRARNQVRDLVLKSGVIIPNNAALEISHHYGLDKFYEYGLSMVTVVNEGYCKKLLISLPNQEHPTQWHEEKTETFVVLYGEVKLYLDGAESILKPGEVVTIKPPTKHRFIGGVGGSVIEEISTTHYIDDSYYDDSSITDNKNRKTVVTHWMG